MFVLQRSLVYLFNLLAFDRATGGQETPENMYCMDCFFFWRSSPLLPNLSGLYWGAEISRDQTKKVSLSQRRNECLSTYWSIRSCTSSPPASRSWKRRQMMFALAQPGNNHSSKDQRQAQNIFSMQFYCGQLVMLGFTFIHGCEIMWRPTSMNSACRSKADKVQNLCCGVSGLSWFTFQRR